MKFINKQKIKSYSLKIIFIIVLFSAIIYSLYLIYPIQQFTITTVANLIYTTATVFLVIITNKNIQQSRKEKQVANEKQYTIQAIMNALDFIYLIPSECMKFHISFCSTPNNEEPLNQAFINAKKNLNFLPEKAIQYLFYVNACLRLSKHHYKNTDPIIVKKIGDINMVESITHYIFSSSTIGEQLRPKKYTIYDVLENFDENLKAVIKDENFSWKNHNWKPINDEDTIKKYKEEIEQEIKEGNPNP